jgi:hypothetical protein
MRVPRRARPSGRLARQRRGSPARAPDSPSAAPGSPGRALLRALRERSRSPARQEPENTVFLPQNGSAHSSRPRRLQNRPARAPRPVFSPTPFLLASISTSASPSQRVSPGVSPSTPCARCAASLATAPRCGRRRARRRGELALPSSLPFLPCTVPSSELRNVGEKLPSLFSPTFFPVAAVPASLAPSRRGLVAARSPLPSLAASRPCAQLFHYRRESQHAASRCPGVQTPRALALLLRAVAST